jgi:hypothetical protein
VELQYWFLLAASSWAVAALELRDKPNDGKVNTMTMVTVVMESDGKTYSGNGKVFHNH